MQQNTNTIFNKCAKNC